MRAKTFKHTLPQLLYGMGIKRTWMRQIDRPLGNDSRGRAAHQQNAIGHKNGFVYIVGHQQSGCVPAMHYVYQKILHLTPGDGIEGRKRLIGKQQLWFARQSPGERNTLRHTAG